MARELPPRLGKGNMNEVLRALGVDDKYCDEIHLLKPWIDNIYLENVLTLEEEEASDDNDALGFMLEELDEKIKKHGIDPNYLDTSNESNVLLEHELNDLELIDTTDIEREVCQSMKKIVKELQEKDDFASKSLQNNVDLCLELWENIQCARHEICEIVQEITHCFSDNKVDEFKQFLNMYEDKLKTLYNNAMDIMGGKSEVKGAQCSLATIKVPLSTVEENMMKTFSSQDLEEAISSMKRSLTLLYYTEVSDNNEKDNCMNEFAAVQSRFCLRNYAYPEETLSYKTLLLCEELAEEVVSLKVLIPKSMKSYERKKKHLDLNQELLKALKKNRRLQQFVSALLSSWNMQKKELYNVLKNTSLLYEQDSKLINGRMAALEAEEQKFLAYLHSKTFEEDCFPANLWKAARKFGIPDGLDCGMHSATVLEEQKMNTVLHGLKEVMDECERKTKEAETIYSELTASAVEQEQLLKQMEKALAEAEEVLLTQKEKHQRFKEDTRAKVTHLCWAHFLVEPQKLIRFAEKLKEERDSAEFLSPDWDVPMHCSTPKSFED